MEVSVSFEHSKKVGYLLVGMMNTAISIWQSECIYKEALQLTIPTFMVPYFRSFSSQCFVILRKEFIHLGGRKLDLQTHWI